LNQQEKKQLTGKKLLTVLEAACKGLVNISETDSPIIPILEPATGQLSIEGFVREHLPSGGGQPIAAGPADEFFRRATLREEWHGPREHKRTEQFAKLRDVMYRNLEPVELIRAGHVKIEIFVLGFDSAGNIAGFRTNAVET